MTRRDVIVIGASAGGLEALQTILRSLPADLPASVLVVLHTSARRPSMLANILDRAGATRASQAVEGEPLEHGRVYVAPPDHHLLVKDGHIGLSRGPKENRVRPSVDALFRTAAASLGARVIGVILTGYLDDGTAGLAAVKECGGLAVVQNPADALYPSMPASAARHVPIDHLVPLAGIGPLLARIAGAEVPDAARGAGSRRLEIEARFAEMKRMELGEMDLIGTRSGVTCPECHGPLWRIADGTIKRFRCHVGHAFSSESMVAGQIDSQEVHLWQAMRLMKERIQVLKDLATHEQEESHGERAAAYEARIAQLEKNLDTLQQMIEDEQP